MNTIDKDMRKEATWLFKWRSRMPERSRLVQRMSRKGWLKGKNGTSRIVSRETFRDTRIALASGEGEQAMNVQAGANKSIQG